MQISKNIGNYILIKENNKKKLLDEIKKAKKKKLLVVFQPSTEEILRFALEKTPIDFVVGVERIHPKEHTHYVRSGLDQVLCKIAAAKGKTILFDFNSISNSSRLMARMHLNIKICKKYKVKMLFTDLSGRISVKDLTSFVRVIEKSKRVHC